MTQVMEGKIVLPISAAKIQQLQQNDRGRRKLLDLKQHPKAHTVET